MRIAILLLPLASVLCASIASAQALQHPNPYLDYIDPAGGYSRGAAWPLYAGHQAHHSAAGREMSCENLP